MKIMWKNEIVAKVNERNGAVSVIGKLPYDLYLEEDSGTDFDVCISNLSSFNSWCAGRVLTLDREHAKSILNSCGFSQATTDKERSKIAQAYHCLTLTDSFWTQKDNEFLDFQEINLYENSLSNAAVDISLSGKSLTLTNAHLIAPDCSTDGVFPKAWVRKQDATYLYKGEKQNTDSVRKEVESSAILGELGIPVLAYDYAEWEGETVARCKIFTNPSLSYVTAESYQFNHSVASLLENNARYDLDFHLMNLADYLVGNTDRHWGNWGFLYNEAGIVSSSPLMDFNHSFEANQNTPNLPYAVFSKHLVQKEAACISLLYIKEEFPEKYEQLVCNMAHFSKTPSAYHYSDYVKQKIDELKLEKERVDNKLVQSADYGRLD